MTSTSYRQKRATMINDSDIDSWKTGSDFPFNGFVRREYGLVDHRVRSGENATLTQVKNSSSGPEIRYINPAIYAESVSEEGPENDREQEGLCQI